MTKTEALTTEKFEQTESTRDRHLKAGISFALLGAGVAAIAVFAVASEARTVLRLNITRPDVSFAVPTALTMIALGAIAFALGAIMLAGIYRRLYVLATSGAVAAIALALVLWGFGRPGVQVPLESLLAGTLFLALPLILGSLSGVLCERNGVINIGIEGQFLMGAFVGALAATIANNPYIGIIFAMIAGSLTTMLLAVMAVRYQVNQIVLGVILNVLALGLTGFLFDRVMRDEPISFNRPGGVPRLGSVLEGVPVLEKLPTIPLVGPLLFNQNIFVYAALFAVVFLWFALFHTRWGLRTRAVGEHPHAADSVGINVNRFRFWNVTAAGMLSGMGGAFFTIGQTLAFSKNMSAGLGFVALAVMIIGRWNPFGALAGALMIGFLTETQRQMASMPGGSPIPSEFLSMLPYIATIVVVAGLVGRAKPPAANGQPFTPGG
ncbi:ABC transporter permease [Natronoglycomyces albus]|uniref:ABC transporter permease n=1 Tax=Natronoglycomyces albus TaxID=2811108 RepID=A0A895XR37_9ACTN|nr:ABC transporter permease [Natronoglycomyces albus]QSB05829.1 ABC transporter permease [Natronoglycomyces albus]